MLNIFYSTIFSKKAVFSEKKLFWEHIQQFFRERRRLAPKINVTFFIMNEVRNILLLKFFLKKLYFLKKRQKTISGAQVSFEGNGASGDENKYNLEYLFILQFF